MNEELTLQEWLHRYRDFKAETAAAKSTPAAVDALVKHLILYKGTRARLGDVDRDFCEGFLRYLTTAQSQRGGGTLLSPRTQHHYYVVMKAALAMAVREGLLLANPMTAVRREYLIRQTDAEREYLTLEELRRMMDTPFFDDETRRAFLFSCFTGLRISDLRRLTWAHLQPSVSSTGECTLRLSITIKKTGRLLSFHLSQEALRWLTKRGKPEDCVFRLPSDVTVNKHMKQWVAQAGVGKRLCFHSARHTFATAALTLGVDIYTTSKLLGHASVSTTQVYARIIDRKKDEAMRRFDSYFLRVCK